MSDIELEQIGYLNAKDAFAPLTATKKNWDKTELCRIELESRDNTTRSLLNGCKGVSIVAYERGVSMAIESLLRRQGREG